ncbi:MAG: hypothetical protein VYD54_04205 [Bdellovibrionota bacterium]|nr:hypothetical protein [Bdellovibrionota bacterium]|tara:strand:+ start:625 stop:912 length:288 start_codon:yes stop_codon:yes gene_type:complete
MLIKNQESIQLLNTAIIKNKEKKIDSKFEERLANTCQAPAMEALGLAITHLSNELSISRDQAAILIVDTIKELETSWNDYLLIEGIEKIKENLKN